MIFNNTANIICISLAIITVVSYIVLMLYFFHNKKDLKIMSTSATIALFVVLGSILVSNHNIQERAYNNLLAEQAILKSKATPTPKPTPTPTPKVTSAPVEKKSDSSSKSEYYSFLTKDGEGLTFNITTEEFLENYNAIKPSYEDYGYKEIEISDFYYVEDGNSINGTPLQAYGCSLTIMGLNNDFSIMLNKEKNSDRIASISFGVKNYNLYKGQALTQILIQYRLLIQALGISESSAMTFIDDMSTNLRNCNVFGTYSNGLALYLDTGFAEADWYRIVPCTKEQWRNAPGLNQISIR